MEYRISVIGFLLLILRALFQPIFWFKSWRTRIALRPIDEPLLLESATNLAMKIRSKILSSEEIVQAYIKRIQDVNPVLNAVVEDRFEAAIEDAKLVDSYIYDDVFSKEVLQETKPLFGVPVTIKESCCVAGLSHSVGSLTRRNIKATKDGEAVHRLKAAGAIPLIVSNTPELCLSWECNNLLTGVTCNSHNTNYSSGGSSGGEGALLGAGASVIGLGSDIAGSIRIPALFNGIYGHKSTPGVIPLEGHYPLSPDENFSKYLVMGPLTRFAKDLKLLMKVLAGNVSTQIGLDQEVDLSTLTVYFMNEVPGYRFVIIPVQQEIKIALENAVKYLEEVCHSNISNYNFEDMNVSCEISLTLYFSLKDIPNLLDDPANYKRTSNIYVEVIKSIFGKSIFYLDTLLFYILQKTNIFIPKKKHGKYINASRALRETFIEKLGTSGVFLYPTFPTSAFHHGEIITNVSGVVYPMIFNILGFPATHVPLGVDKKGMPIGLQVVAAPKQDRLCLAVAVALEEGFGGWVKPDSNM